MWQIQVWLIVYGENNQILIIISNIIIICILITVLIKKLKNENTLVKIFFYIILAGGISNLIDRVFRGYVVDYIDINKIISYPIFNIADIAVVLGVILLIGYIIIKMIKNRRMRKGEGI